MPSLTQTPMERRLLETIERLEEEGQARDERLRRKISDLRTCFVKQQNSVERLNAWLASWMESSDQP